MSPGEVWVKDMLALFDTTFCSSDSTFASVDEFLHSEFDCAEKLEAWVGCFEDSFPPDVVSIFAKTVEAGPRVYRWWQLGYRPECGNSGYLCNTTVR
jgi:hypothetical protein